MTGDRNSPSTDPIDDGAESSTSPLRLKGAQRRIADEYFDADSGLFVLNCVPGAGKSFVRSDLAAKELLRRWVDGDPTPEQRLCVITFNRNEAASIKAEIIDRMRTLVTHNLTQAAATMSADDVEQLIQRVRRAPYIGTIDSVLRTLFGDIVGDIGFAEVPTVGNDAILEHIHDACYDALESDPEHMAALERLQEAYPQREYDAGVDELLRQALQYCRSHQLAVTEFKTRLADSVEAVYVEREPTAVADITAAIARCVSEEEAASALSQLDEQDQRALIDGDRDLYHSWQNRIDEFCTLLDVYQTEYDNRIRDKGVISHLDCAYFVAEYLGNMHGDTLMSQSDVNDDSQRTRVRDRYRTRIESWIIDEAQDLSNIQHAALASFVTSTDRVAVAGDIRQSIYGWRDAHPELFASAISEGTYFGIDWDPHIVETATRTYRCRPDVAAAVNAITKPALTDSTRGDLGDLDIEYPHLEPVREPSSGPSVHIATFDSYAQPGTKPYISPDSGKGEADLLATYIACGLADGTLSTAKGESNTTRDDGEDSDAGQDNCDAHDSEPAVTVLFRRRQYMDQYTEAFESQGLSVVNASEPLFDCPSVQVVVDIVDWLRDPVDVGRTQSLIRGSTLGLASLAEVFKHHGRELDSVLDDNDASLSDRQVAILERLREIRDSQGIQHTYPAPELAEEIIAILELRADSFDIAGTVSPAQRVANLDAFSEWLQTLDTEDTITPNRFIELIEPFRETPQKGPTQSLSTTATGDVEFQTIHQMKGDEASIVALADPGFDIWFPGPPNQRFITSGDIAALSPPETGNVPQIESLSAFTGGLYSPATAPESSRNGDPPTGTETVSRDVGLRWATEKWHEHDNSTSPELVGHNHLQTIAQNRRAESWRLLYVALTRAKNHLILPLPRTSQENAITDRWVDTIQTGLEFDGSPRSGTYNINGPVDGDSSLRSVSVSVNDVSLEPGAVNGTFSSSHDAESAELLFAGTVASAESDLHSFLPRILRPSTLAPLYSDPHEWVLKHLKNEPLRTAADTVDEDLPFSSESLRPDEVGELVHEILASVIDYAVSETSTEPEEYELRAIAESLIDSRFPELPSGVVDEVFTFLWEWIFPQFINSDCWHRIMTADDVYTEKTLSGQIQSNDVEFEFDGASDIVLQADGDWEVIDVKIALGDILPETKHRYQLQTESYAFLLREEVAGEVHSCIEVYGAERTTILANELSDDFLEYLERLYDNCISA
jgi:ATP-dependent helicase/nuclease subunit A